MHFVLRFKFFADINVICLLLTFGLRKRMICESRVEVKRSGDRSFDNDTYMYFTGFMFFKRFVRTILNFNYLDSFWTVCLNLVIISGVRS